MKWGKLVPYTPWFLIILNLVLKSLWMGQPSIAGDEPFSIYHAQLDITAIVHQLSTGNNPPLYELLLHYWIKVFGITPYAVRLPSVIFSSLAVWFIYKMGQTWFSNAVGLVAGLLFTFSNLNLLLAHEARVYALMVFLTTGSMFYFLKIMEHSSRNTWFCLLWLFNGLLVYAHYFGFWIIGIQTLSFLLFKTYRKRSGGKYWIYLTGILIMYLPNMMIFIHRFWDSSVHGTWLKKPEGIADLYNMLRLFSNQPLTTVVCLMLCTGFISTFIFRKHAEHLPLASRFILIWWLFPFLGMFVISFLIPMYFDRYLLFVTPAFYLSLAMMTGWVLKHSLWRWISYTFLCLLFMVTFNPAKDNKRHVAEMVQKVCALKETPGTMVIMSPSSFLPNFAYYYDRNLFQKVDGKELYGSMRKGLEGKQVWTCDSIQDNFLNYKRIIFLDAGGSFSNPQNPILSSLKARYLLKDKLFFEEIFWVYVFELELTGKSSLISKVK